MNSMTLYELLRSIQRRWLDFTVEKWARRALECRAERFSAIFKEWLPTTGSKILDIGGGWGFYGAAMEKLGYDVTVLDVIRPSFQKSPVLIYDGNRIPFDRNAFQGSMMVTMLHHVHEPEKLIREMTRVTEDFVIVVEDLYHHRIGFFWTVLRDMFYNAEWLGHPKQFKKHEEWIRIFEDRGWKLKRSEKIYSFLAGLRILNGVYLFQK